MRHQRFQNKVAESGFTLPVASVITIILWMVNGISYSFHIEESELWNKLQQNLPNMLIRNLLGLMFCGITAYLLVELNNENALIRIRTRLMTTVYVVIMGAISFLHPLQVGHITAMCMLLAYHAMFRTYQKHNPVGHAFNAFFFMAVASLFYSRLLLLAPVYLILMALYMQSLSVKTFFAALLGTMLPYWFWSVYLFFNGRIELFIRPFMKILEKPHFDYSMITTHQLFSVGFVLLLSIISIGHYMTTALSDKIRVRMLYQFLIVNEVMVLAGLALLPEQFNLLFMLFVVNSSTLISHFFALSKSKISNITFITSIIILVALAIYNIWSPLVSFS